MSEIMEPTYKNQEENFSNEKQEAILQLEPLSNDESFVLNDIFDNCLETDEDHLEVQQITLKSSNSGEDSEEQPAVVKIKCDNVDVHPQCPIIKSEIKVESTVVEDSECIVKIENNLEDAVKSEPRPEEVYIKEATTSFDDTVKATSVDYSSTEVCKFMESDSDGEDNESNLQIDMDTDSLGPLLDAYHSVKLTHCVKCKSTFVKKTAFYDHVLSTHERFYLHCFYCKQKVSLKQLKIHLKEHITKESLTSLPFRKAVEIIAVKCELTCEICGLGFTTSLSLCTSGYTRIQNHLMRHIKVPFKCELCNRIFSGRAPLKKHIICHQKNSCLDCDKVFNSSKLLKQHLKYHQSTPIVCEICGQKFFMKIRYSRHILNHANFECDLCDSKFLTSSKLKAHQANHPRIIKCNICNAKFKLRRELARHHRKIHKIGIKELPAVTNEYECMKCMKTFKTMVEYSLHSHI